MNGLLRVAMGDRMDDFRRLVGERLDFLVSRWNLDGSQKVEGRCPRCGVPITYSSKLSGMKIYGMSVAVLCKKCWVEQHGEASNPVLEEWTK